MKRRHFVSQTLGTAAALSLPLIATAGWPLSAGQVAVPPRSGKPGKFKLRYAPSFGMFKAHTGDDLTAQIQFCADEGFTAMFDNGIMNRPADQQKLISRELAKRGMLLGPFVLYADFAIKSFVLKDRDVRAMLLEKMKQGVETMRRTGCKQALVVPGRYDESLSWEYQTANVIDNLRACLDVCRPAGLDPRPRAAQPEGPPRPVPDQNPPGLRQICRAVNNPGCKIRRRHVPPADHRREPHPQHRGRLGRNRRLSPRRQPRPQGADNRRNQLTGTSSNGSTERATRAFSAWNTARAAPAKKASGR